MQDPLEEKIDTLTKGVALLIKESSATRRDVDILIKESSATRRDVDILSKESSATRRDVDILSKDVALLIKESSATRRDVGRIVENDVRNEAAKRSFVGDRSELASAADVSILLLGLMKSVGSVPLNSTTDLTEQLIRSVMNSVRPCKDASPLCATMAYPLVTSACWMVRAHVGSHATLGHHMPTWACDHRAGLSPGLH